MTLYEFIKITKNDYDTYDNVYDGVITVCAFDREDEKSDEYYEKFRIGIMKFVEVVRGTADKGLLCKWSEFISRNIKVFREFTEKYWYNQYKNKDDFIYEWINEIHNWIAGALSESMYKEFVENYMSRMI